MSAVREMIREGTRRLEAAGVANARHESEWLLGRLLNAAPLALYLYEGSVPQDALTQFDAQIDARASGLPLQYLLKEAQFVGRRFAVVPGVFIPRPETEAVVEAAVTRLRDLEARLGRPLRLLDFGTGSGCIAVTLACELPTCVLVGVELSWNALRIAQGNTERHGCAARVHLVQGWWADAISGTFDGIIANPPYVPTALVEQLPRDVRHEPRLSLDGGADGMRDLSQLVTQVPRLLAPGGWLVLECGEAQPVQLLRDLQRTPWAESIQVVHDLAGRPRGVMAVRPPLQRRRASADALMADARPYRVDGQAGH